ncbi:hypothetical protein KKH27_00715 [bacterium]|nr:hypothetical protein [bacterium]MBU1984226.1 hypothetical protein [bacterium]
MKSFLVSLIVLLAVSVSLAGEGCAKSCARTCGKSKASCETPKAAYDYTSAYYMPDCAPPSLQQFHGKLIPVMEARKSSEFSYVRESSAALYAAARDVLKAKPCCDGMNYKQYRRAAKDLVRNCKKLKEICYGGAPSALDTHVQTIEEDFVRLANCCQ